VLGKCHRRATLREGWLTHVDGLFVLYLRGAEEEGRRTGEASMQGGTLSPELPSELALRSISLYLL